MTLMKKVFSLTGILYLALLAIISLQFHHLILRSEVASDEEQLKTLQKILPNLPPLKNSTHFAWKSYPKKPKSLLSCTHRPKLIDIKEGFVFEIKQFLFTSLKFQVLLYSPKLSLMKPSHSLTTSFGKFMNQISQDFTCLELIWISGRKILFLVLG